MKPLVIYHGVGCTDGFGAAFAAWLKLGDSAEYLPMEYGATYSFDLSGVVVNHVWYEINEREVFILDFGFPREVMEDIFVHAKRVVWLDHHKTAFEMWLGATPTHGQYVLGVPNTIWLDNNKSGAVLAWEYFHPDTEVPMLIQRIDDYDRGRFKLNDTKEFHAALASYKPWSFEQWESFLVRGNLK